MVSTECHKYFHSRNHEYYNYYTRRRQFMSIAKMLERLAEMFPKQDYQSKLERYISSKYPTSVTDVEHHTNAFQRNEFRGLGL